MSRPRDGEQNWYPIGKADWFTRHIREGIEVTAGHLALLRPARERPWLLDEAMVARIIRVHRGQAGDLTLFQGQADRWKTASLTTAQRAAVDEYQAALAQLRQVNSEVLAVAAELAGGTIETVLAKSDLELAIEALTRGLRP